MSLDLLETLQICLDHLGNLGQVVCSHPVRLRRGSYTRSQFHARAASGMMIPQVHTEKRTAVTFPWVVPAHAPRAAFEGSFIRHYATSALAGLRVCCPSPCSVAGRSR
jgi:hypothetical protein